MAGQDGGRRTARLWSALAALCIASAALVGCDHPAPADPAQANVQSLLDRRARAVLDRDETDYLATGGAGEDAAATRRSATAFRNLAAVPLESWAYRVTSFHRSGAIAGATAELRYRIDGYDSAAVTASRDLTLHRRDGRWYVTADRPAEHGPQQLWEQGRVTAVTGAHSLVLGVGQDTARLKDFARLADRAVPAVRQAWGMGSSGQGAPSAEGGGGKRAGWSGRVLVEVPGSLDGMAALLGAPAAGYRGIAAVTTGETGGSSRAPADRIIVNPDAYRMLSGLGRQVVLTHETTHVATRTVTSPATPLWLSEGYADWVGYRGTGRTPGQAAPELRSAVRQGRVPKALPSDADFRFSQQADPLAEAYEGGWLACRMIADQWGEARLREFYRAVGTHTERAGAVDGALRDVLGIDTAAFTARWRTYLRTQLR
ncbi:hypothetical protein [Streptomyces sp. TS71-3]|uniref:hypothetical protein n=1 Tax=Streptomyces sp. TS71-3 TaxID=2733862 RepID=UPI001B0860E7|nr:hypothetical protein [Streptomyces sp. TS71-3]GHJ38172.1 hypothetical protein Sm713_37810 [Streptomyces sp. TS71-3]